jgi:tetratricopeptide (TPR) repeat protein
MIFLAVQTARQQDYWLDQRTFVSETAARAGCGVRMLVNLGQIAAADGQDQKALALYHEALKMEPALAVAHFNVATIAFRQKDYAFTLDELSKAEVSPLFHADALVLRAAIAEAQTGRPQIALLAQAADAAPRNWSICRRLPLKLVAIGKPNSAYEDILRQNNVRPYRADAWRLLGQIAEKLGQPAIAARAYGEAANRDTRDSVSRERLRALRSSL